MAQKKHDAEDDVELKDLSIEDDMPVDEEKTETPHEIVEPEQHEGLKPARTSWFKRLFATKKRKIILGCAGVLVVLGVLYAVPVTRYGILGTMLKKNVTVMVTDSVTHKPVTSATVVLNDKTVTTTEKGEASFTSIPVGDYTVKVTKKYYKDTSFSYTVPVFGNPARANTSLVATGRQVSITVVNTVSKVALAKASIVVGGTTALTDDKGRATIVLPADTASLPGTVSLSGYNDAKVTVTVTDQADKNNFSLTPAGTIYYLSNATGRLNVMKSNLDGTNAQVAVQGTGNEDARSTVLLASRDWKYLALQSHRTNDSPTQLYLLNAQTGALTLIGQAANTNESFSLVGWSGHRFIYTTYNYNVADWQAGRQQLKSYDADSAKLSTIDQTAAGGTNAYNAAYENITSPYILGSKIFYGKGWWANSATYNSSTPLKQTAAIMSINADGSQMTRIKEFPLNSTANIEARLYEPQSLYFRVTADNGNPTFYVYEGGKLKPTSAANDSTFYNTTYPTYLVSPASDKTFWQEFRDGKNTLFVGDQNGDNAKTIASLSDYSTYGWYSNDYLLLSKNGSELYIARADQPLSPTNQPLKITNYYKPQYSYPGYGYGYGGI